MFLSNLLASVLNCNSWSFFYVQHYIMSSFLLSVLVKNAFAARKLCYINRDTKYSLIVNALYEIHHRFANLRSFLDDINEWAF